jgi:hypothetical protein
MTTITVPIPRKKKERTIRTIVESVTLDGVKVIRISLPARQLHQANYVNQVCRNRSDTKAARALRQQMREVLLALFQ